MEGSAAPAEEGALGSVLSDPRFTARLKRQQAQCDGGESKLDKLFAQKKKDFKPTPLESALAQRMAAQREKALAREGVCVPEKEEACAPKAQLDGDLAQKLAERREKASATTPAAGKQEVPGPKKFKSQAGSELERILARQRQRAGDGEAADEGKANESVLLKLTTPARRRSAPAPPAAQPAQGEPAAQAPAEEAPALPATLPSVPAGSPQGSPQGSPRTSPRSCRQGKYQLASPQGSPHGLPQGSPRSCRQGTHQPAPAPPAARPSAPAGSPHGSPQGSPQGSPRSCRQGAYLPATALAAIRPSVPGGSPAGSLQGSPHSCRHGKYQLPEPAAVDAAGEESDVWETPRSQGELPPLPFSQPAYQVPVNIPREEACGCVIA